MTGHDGSAAASTRRVIATRPAELADAPPLADLHVRAWQVGYRGLMSQGYLDTLDVAERTAAWRERLGDLPDDVRTLVGTLDDQVTGFASFGPAGDPESGADGELYALNVHPASGERASGRPCCWPPTTASPPWAMTGPRSGP